VADTAEVKETAVLDKKARAAWRTNHDLHVLLIMRQNDVSKADAGVQAYFEGLDGLKKRLG
jgi:hypothetical protein